MSSRASRCLLQVKGLPEQAHFRFPIFFFPSLRNTILIWIHLAASSVSMSAVASYAEDELRLRRCKGTFLYSAHEQTKADPLGGDILDSRDASNGQ